MDDQQRRTGGIGEGIRTGLGILNAFKDAVEETLQEAVDRGDLAPERATRAMKDAAQRFQSVFDETREKMELVPRRDFDILKAEVSALRERLDRLEGRPSTEGGEETPSGIIVTD